MTLIMPADAKRVKVYYVIWVTAQNIVMHEEVGDKRRAEKKRRHLKKLGTCRVITVRGILREER